MQRTSPASRPAPPSGPRRRAVWGRWLLERLVFMLVAVLVFQTWYLSGALVPMKISSGSMAPGLLGPRQEVVCGDCGYPFACGLGGRPRRWAVCPNCGYPANDLAHLPDLEGDGVLVSKAVFNLRRPRRWEVVAFRHPEHAQRIAVKRVIGLPGESVEIRNGEVYVDGRIQRKPLAQQKAMAVLVHDANFAPRHSRMPPRWHGDRADSRWEEIDGCFLCPAASNPTSIDWLSYRHWCRLPGQPGKVHRVPITNASGYSQAYPQRSENVHPVGDLWLSFRLMKPEGEGELHVMLTDGRRPFRVRLDPKRARFEVSYNGQTRNGAWPKEARQQPDGCQIDVLGIDCQWTLALAGHVVVAWPYEPGEEPPQARLRPAAIGVRGLGVQIADLKLYRDVYYTRPVGRDARWGVDRPFRLGEDEYFVLGDNSTVSLDSRTWPSHPAVPSELVVGKPFLVHVPIGWVTWGERASLVPALDRIRYIR